MAEAAEAAVAAGKTPNKIKKAQMRFFYKDDSSAKTVLDVSCLTCSEEKYVLVSVMMTFRNPISPIKFGMAIQPLTISAKIKIESNDINGPIAIQTMKMILYGLIPFKPVK